jgi:Polyketide cyclase / dehydrase and lipid transport
MRRTVRAGGWACAAVIAGSGATRAEVVGAAANGFEVRETVHVSAAADKAFALLLQPARWWDSDHTFSGAAANLTLEPRAGGCWCESLPDGGSVEHLRVVYVAPGRALRLRGALGPLQPLGVEGALSMTVSPAARGADITFAYAVGGFTKDGLAALAALVDRVLGEQAGRLKHLLDAAPG